MSEWLKEAVCKIVGASLRRFESCSAHQIQRRGCPWDGRAVCQLLQLCFNKIVVDKVQVRRYNTAVLVRENRSCVLKRPRSSVVEHFFGKEEVKGPIPFVGSMFRAGLANVRAQAPKELV